MRKNIRIVTAVLSALSLLCMVLLVFGYYMLPDVMTVSGELPVVGKIYTPVTSQDAVACAVSIDEPVQTEETYSLFGTVPVKTVSVVHSERKTVYVGGDVIGLQMLTDGVVIADVQAFDGENGSVAPAADAGLQKGDIVTAINGTEITDNYAFVSAVENCNGEQLQLDVLRGNEHLTISVLPQKCKNNGKYRCGAWVKDSTVGIGTMTYYDPQTGVYGALGHSVCDADTGEVLPIAGGQIVDAYVWNIKKGQSGTAGELGGSLQEEVIGSIEKNCQSGIYGLLYEEPLCAGEYPVAWATEVKTGPAEIMLSLDGEVIESYDVNIKRINADYNAEIKNMVIEITDENLLEKTGGIVQGMSGSPILQDGKLIGAVTHVLVNDPTQGYGIFIENMLNAAA